MIEINGAFGEGGGQVVRTALALAALTGQATHIRHIRAKRRTPGLAPQHLTGVQALAHLCHAEVQGARLRSTEVIFRPRSAPRPGKYYVDVAEAAQGGSAGAVTLIFQTVLFPLLLATGESHLTLKGGTHVAWSPPFDYIVQVYLPTLARMGGDVTGQLDAWGFYPRGEGQFIATISGLDGRDAGAEATTGLERGFLKPLTLTERGPLRQVWGRAVACNLPAHIAQRMANRAGNVLREAGLATNIVPERVRGPGMGAGLFLVAEYEKRVASFSALGRKGKPSEVVADEACRDLLAHHAANAPVDLHLADQLLLPMTLAKGQSRFRTTQITRHLLTNAHIIRQFIPARIVVEGEEGQVGTVFVDGVGL